MDSNKSKFVDDENMKQAYQKYELLKNEVEQWQQERGSYWSAQISLAEQPPYLSIVDLPSEAIIELWQRLNLVAKAEISESALKEMLEQFNSGQNPMDAEMTTRVQMAVSGVAKLASLMADNKTIIKLQSNTVCPVCGEQSMLAAITPPNGKRMMQCTLCGFEWAVKRVGCLFCESEDAKQQIYLQNEAFPNVEMVVCQTCGQYFKEIDARELADKDYLWEDLKSLQLNFATKLWLKEQGKNPKLVN
ncbi:MAG: formate dehydrogenase accessory protein FdhE [Syntrophomonadaceae bacterium]|nr:formate dehydrogenase accessory protein FdhE [Syntrophomonadaceae bacterium]